jgi:hypothetical protein
MCVCMLMDSPSFEYGPLPVHACVGGEAQEAIAKSVIKKLREMLNT